MNVESVIAKLPSGLREALTYKLDVSKLRDACTKANDDVEYSVAAQNLADMIKNPLEKDDLYFQAMTKAPDAPEVIRAYSYFLLRKESKTTISIQAYHRFIAKLPPVEQSYAWSSGLFALKSRQAAVSELYTYLIPLLSERPPFRDYRRLYEELQEVARKMKRIDMQERARDMEDYCYDLPSLDESITQELMKKLQASDPQRKK